jgi:glycosyltransferase involved in cell wall biosynthesis
MPNLLIDTERLRDPFSGLGQFCRHLGAALVRQQPADAQLTFLVPPGQAGVFGSTVGYRTAGPLAKLWLQGRFDAWHGTHQDSAFGPGPGSRTKTVLTIHDLNFLERPDLSPARKAQKLTQLQRRIDAADALTAISAFTAGQVRHHLQLAPDRPIHLIHNGVADLTTLVPTQRPAFLPASAGPFFLFLGVIHPKKNVHVLLPLLEAFPDWHLVLAGPDGHSYAQHLRAEADRLGVSARLWMPGAVDEPTKAWLYAHCGAFLFPSLAEGFGLPVVEAMQAGKPVFLAQATSLPEIGGPDAYYFPSLDPEPMAETIFDSLRDFGQNPFRAIRLQKRAATFSWERAAAAYWQVYADL